jgi:hypothetical protein
MMAIQALADHVSPQTTQKHMHLGTGVRAAAARLVCQPAGTLGARLSEEATNP